MARIYHGAPREIVFLARRLRAGALVAVPTETVYGLAANALDARACRKIFSVKGRPASDPLIVHLHSAKQLADLCHPNPAAMILADRFWPGPLTMVLPKKEVVPDIVTAGQPSVAVRIPAHPLFRRLLKLTGLPLAAPSANPFGYISPTTAAHVQDSLGRKIAYILDGGAARIGVESTIIDLRDPEKPRLLRPGAITKEELAATLGRRVLAPMRSTRKPRELEAQIAPGLLARHYSPRTRLVLHEKLGRAGKSTEAFVFLRKPVQARAPNVFWLDPHGEPRGIARRLFATLRRLDTMGFRRIHIELVRGKGITEAINDRLRRAAAR